MNDLNVILELVDKFYKKNTFKINSGKVPVSGKVYDQEELKNLVECSLEGWWTEGKWNRIFENKIKNFLGIKFVLTVNSGSSANLLALKCLTSQRLGKRRIQPGDEVITAAAAFPTTVNPIIEVGAIPVFVDVKLGTYNVEYIDLEKAVSPKTKAIFLAHTLGNPFDLKKIKGLCKEKDIWLIEDNCDALGSKYSGQYTGTFGDLATLSFYPAHHITTGEGGALITNNPCLYKIARSMRDWGRDCCCPTGKDDTCKRRFSWQLGDLPYGYDHKYIYSELGCNFKMTDLQAAIGVAQMDKLNSFILKRKNNFDYMYQLLVEFKNYFVLPEITINSEPSWFGFPLTIKENKLNRNDLLNYLNDKMISTRLLFGGNIIKQPYFKNQNYKLVGHLKNTDIIMANSFWVGVYPAITEENIQYVVQIIKEFIVKIENNGN